MSRNSTSTAPGSGIRVDHESWQALARALARHAVWFSPSGSDYPSILTSRLREHRCGSAVALTVESLTIADFLPLRSITRCAFITSSDSIAPTFPDADLVAQLAKAGFKLFFSSSSEGLIDGRIGGYALIGEVEFLLSSIERLNRFPVNGGARAMAEHPSGRASDKRKAVVLLDLVQDFEVLKPLLTRAAAFTSPFDLVVAVSERVAQSSLGELVSQFLRANEIVHFTPIGPVDIAAALGNGKSLLLSASESSAGPHRFAHNCCLIAPARTMRVTIQHGLECVGLRHHRAHDLDFPHGVRFASDLILTWDHPDALPSLHAAEADKCVPVGVVKAIAERSASRAGARWNALLDGVSGKCERVLIAENLRSVRFKAPGGFQRFLGLIETVSSDSELDLTIRSHPANGLLEKSGTSSQLKFLGGLLKADDFDRFDLFVSPPSTVILDAVCAGVTSAVWSSGGDVGDAMNYRGLPIVTDFGDLAPLLGSDRGAHVVEQQNWAVGATSALNGVPAAWSTLCHVMT